MNSYIATRVCSYVEVCAWGYNMKSTVPSVTIKSSADLAGASY